jgi:hypothetical protein
MERFPTPALAELFAKSVYFNLFEWRRGVKFMKNFKECKL